ncbi:transposase [uncultured Bacteroides sp.]|uniref:IS66 family transposase n=1 Tax=uncultured Bacteroides sp. TaxID=162156 RepID=UPI0026159C90|nr:transposase [uncultured Bacteroides sp.]
MNLEELQQRILMRNHLEQRETYPVAPQDPTDGMSPEDIRKYALFLHELLQEKDRENDRLKEELADNKTELKRMSGIIERYTQKLEENDARLEKERNSNQALHDQISELLRENKKLNDRIGVLLSDYYGSSKSRKGTSRNTRVRGKNDNRDGLVDDDTTTAPDSKEPAATPEKEEPEQEYQKVDKPQASSRKGTTYRKEVVGDPIFHKCDLSKLPEGAVILKEMPAQVIRNVKCFIEEHHFQRFKVKFPDGSIRTVYLPCDDDPTASLYEEIVPGTHVTASLLSYLLFNRYQMCSPDYREAKNRLADMDWNTCRQNLANWADKGAILLNKLIPALKEVALQKGADVNVDETWCRYQTRLERKKTYMWCLVNRKAGIVIFFYEDCEDEDGTVHQGGRRRSVLQEFLGDSQIRSLQSDGYNVYMYLDDDLVDIEHLCCLAHSRNMFKDALNQGCDRAGSFIRKYGALYHREDIYLLEGLSPEGIKKRRNDSYTNEIVESIRNELYDLLALPEGSLSELMVRALKYLKKFWTQLFAFRNNGEYTIDNLAAERAIRPLTVQRKNSLFFRSVQGALRSATYNTIIETCKQNGISFRDYFQRFIAEVKKGRTDYENLLPMTINMNP